MKKASTSRKKVPTSKEPIIDIKYEQGLLTDKATDSFLTKEVAVLNAIGKLYCQKGEYEQGLEYFEYALLSSRENWDSRGEGIIQNNIATVWRNRGQHERALPNYFFALDNFTSTGARFHIVLCLCGISESFLALGNIETAQDNVEHAKEIADTMVVSPKNTIILEQAVVNVLDKINEAIKVLEGAYIDSEDNNNLHKELSDKSIPFLSEHMPDLLHKTNDQIDNEIEQLEKGIEHIKAGLQQQIHIKFQKQKPLEMGTELHGETNVEDKNAVWLAYEQQLEWLNPNFMERFQGVYPTLSRNEIRICSMLAIQMSTKNIAAMLHLDKKAVDKHRQNIRKKMNIPSSGDLALHIALFRE